MRLEDCFSKRMLRRSMPDLNKCHRSMEMAYQRLEKARELRSSDFHEECLVACYSSMLMAARAMMFKDGIIEKNHYCVILYLRANYIEKIGEGPISWLDVYRMERHQWFYGIEGLSTSDQGSLDSLERASLFIDIINNLISK